MNHIDLKHIGIVSSRLDRFKVMASNPYRANCRCPICGDSQKSKHKARGWFLEKENSAIYYCHNCGASMGLYKFLKFVDASLGNDYLIDSKMDKGMSNRRELTKAKKPLDTLQQARPDFTKGKSPLLKIKKVSSLQANHPVKAYLDRRLIPMNKRYRLYYAPKFAKWVNGIIPEKLPSENDKPRLIIPFIDRSGRLFGFTGRAFDKDSLRYVTIMLDENMPKIFGMDEVDYNKKYYVMEGGIDSLFIPNSVAMAGADSNLKGLQNIENSVTVFDNEPRNKDIVKRMEKALQDGRKVCVWPDALEEKDVNDMVKAGRTQKEVNDIIDNSTVSGLFGELELRKWRKV